ncbi:MAG: hypothetical protein QOG62_960 [Thermoleophilaceae bacterium]|jgi:DNA-binding NarL/FixJ family response regulator|nr:hypothetical protein [Thermoleophilaceae bacterium]
MSISRFRSDELTARELEIATRVADGATNREVGEELSLSSRTVEAHLRRIFKKTGVSSRTGLAAHMFRSGMIGGLSAIDWIFGVELLPL